jgi:hypothetical protein
MTEADWLACTEPEPLLEFCRGKANERKLRLFAAACCWRVSQFFKDERCFRAINLAERLAEKQAVADEITSLANELDGVPGSSVSADAGWNAVRWAIAPLADIFDVDDIDNVHLATAYWAAESVYADAVAQSTSPDAWRAARHRERCNQSDLLRDIFGNPFRPTLTIAPLWLGWNDRTVLRLAQAIYDERAFDRMPILADALEDAGCDNVDILSHCRDAGPHVRGCWVLDLLLGKG